MGGDGGRDGGYLLVLLVVVCWLFLISGMGCLM